jgi:hypothetical protein
MYRKTHKVDITEKVVRPLIDQNGDNIIEEMDKADVNEKESG